MFVSQYAFCFVLFLSHKLAQFTLPLFSLSFASTFSSCWLDTAPKSVAAPYEDILGLE